MKIAELLAGWSRDVSCAMDACDSINAYEQFLDVEHRQLPTFEMTGLFELIPGIGTSPIYFIGNHREGEQRLLQRAS